jgi:hypothetical protein
VIVNLAEGLAGRAASQQVDPSGAGCSDERLVVPGLRQIAFHDSRGGKVLPVRRACIRIVISGGDNAEPRICQPATETASTAEQVDGSGVRRSAGAHAADDRERAGGKRS